MTTPLLLTAGSLVVATGAMANALRHASPSRSASPPPTARAAPAVRAEAVPQDPAPKGKPLPAIPTIDKPFTLIYRMTFRNVRTKAMMDALVAERAKELAKEVGADRMTQAEADRVLADMRKPNSPPARDLILSYDGRTFLYEDPTYGYSTVKGGEGTVRNVNLFDGRFSYHFFPSAKNFDSQGDRCPGTVSHYTMDMPYLGPSLPFFPLTKGDGIFYVGAWEAKLHYTPGTVERGPDGSVARLTIGYESVAANEIVLKDFQRFQGRSIARSVVFTKREYAAPFKGLPKERLEYALISASPEPLSADRFVPDSYLSDGDVFSVASVPDRGGVAPKFKVDKAKGTLADQIAAQGGTR